MERNKCTIVVAGIDRAEHLGELRAGAQSNGGTVILAALPHAAGERARGTTCVDLTAHLDAASSIAACDRSVRQGDLVLVREPQLRDEGLARALGALQARCIALDADVSYDSDVSWIVDRIEGLRERVDLAFYAIDLFADVQQAWAFFCEEARADEFGPADLRSICARFPVLLTADVSATNICEMATFPDVAGVLLTCDELQPIVPAHRHAMSFAALRDALHTLLRRKPHGKE